MRYVLRFLWYWIKVLAAIAITMALMGWGFFTAMNISNIWILMNEGLEVRAQTILQDGRAEDMKSCFTDKFIQSDPLLVVGTYDQYLINSFEIRVSVHWVWNWPWQNTATATVTERIPAMDGTAKSEAVTSNPNFSKTPPKWPAGKYKVKLVKEKDGWKIDAMELIGEVPDKWTPPWVTPTPLYEVITPRPDTTPLYEVITPRPDATPLHTPVPGARATPEAVG
nr:hypothetical protein [bacterium]